MLELIVAGYVLAGTICGEEAGRKFCRDVPAHHFGGQYACERKVAQLVEEFPAVPSTAFGFKAETRLHMALGCEPVRVAPGA